MLLCLYCFTWGCPPAMTGRGRSRKHSRPPQSMAIVMLVSKSFWPTALLDHLEPGWGFVTSSGQSGEQKCHGTSARHSTAATQTSELFSLWSDNQPSSRWRLAANSIPRSKAPSQPSCTMSAPCGGCHEQRVPACRVVLFTKVTQLRIL